jgi:hypothetical protein
MNLHKKDKNELFKNIFTAYFIVLLHVFLVVVIGLAVVLFKGVYQYLPWIMAAMGILVIAIAWVVYRRMRGHSSSLQGVLGTPEFQDRAVEVRLLGGLASFKINARENTSLLVDRSHYPVYTHAHLIENAVNQAEQKLLELSTMYEKNLITQEEFEVARQNIIQG